MHVLSNNRNGIVFSVGEGFSPKRAANFIISRLDKAGIKYEYDRARSGSIYLKLELGDAYANIRLSTHTVRTDSWSCYRPVVSDIVEEIEKENEKSYRQLVESDFYVDFNVVNQSMFNAFKVNFLSKYVAL